MDALKSNANIAAMVLGYPVLLVVVLLVAWFALRIFQDLNKIFNEARYERWESKNEERDWSNIEASWLLDVDNEDRYDTDVISGLPFQQHTTDEIPFRNVRRNT